MSEPDKVSHLPIAVREPHSAVVPLSEIQRMAQAVVASKMFGVTTVEQAMSLMLIAQAEGLHPAIAARDYDVIQGRPSKKSEAMLRSFIGNGGRVKWNALDDAIADATFSHPAGGEVRIVWDMKRATTAGLSGKDNYKKWPRQMLRARCISEGVRTVCPMATSGMYVPEEVIDMEPVVVVDDKPLDEAQAKELIEMIVSTGANTDKFLEFINEAYKFNLTKVEELPARLLDDAKKILKNAETARKRAAASKTEAAS